MGKWKINLGIFLLLSEPHIWSFTTVLIGSPFPLLYVKISIYPPSVEITNSIWHCDNLHMKQEPTNTMLLKLWGAEADLVKLLGVQGTPGRAVVLRIAHGIGNPVGVSHIHLNSCTITLSQKTWILFVHMNPK